MKLLSTLMLGSLLVAGAAFAATTSAPTATPAPVVKPAHRHMSAMHCEKLAKNKGLTGDDEKRFVRECREGKKQAG